MYKEYFQLRPANCCTRGNLFVSPTSDSKIWGKIYRGVHVHSLNDCQQTFARREPHQNLVFFPVPIYLFPTTTNCMDGPITHSDQYIPQPGKFSFEME